MESAARVNAMDLFTIIFNTSVGPIMFKSFRNGESPLEEIARHNGHEELACYLEQKHSMYVSPSYIHVLEQFSIEC